MKALLGIVVICGIISGVAALFGNDTNLLMWPFIAAVVAGGGILRELT